MGASTVTATLYAHPDASAVPIGSAVDEFAFPDGSIQVYSQPSDDATWSALLHECDAIPVIPSAAALFAEMVWTLFTKELASEVEKLYEASPEGAQADVGYDWSQHIDRIVFKKTVTFN